MHGHDPPPSTPLHPLSIPTPPVPPPPRQNPFDHLYRDADIEASSDGYDATAYGALDSIRDATMGWGGGGLFLRTFT